MIHCDLDFRKKNYLEPEVVESEMAGPDKEEPVSMAGDSVSGDHDFPVKASPPREQSPSLGEMKQEQTGRKYSLLIG